MSKTRSFVSRLGCSYVLSRRQSEEYHTKGKEKIMTGKTPRVLVLLSSYNGERYIKEQIDSVMNQEAVEVFLLIRDDGSTDKTIDIIREESKRNSSISLICGQNYGYAKSFMTLCLEATKLDYDFFAFCDQDDVWLPEKLKVATSNLLKTKDGPSLYLSQAKIVDEKLNPIKSSFHNRLIDLGPVLEHNFAIGTTMVFNRELLDLLSIDIDKMCLTCGHDSWVFLVALAVNAAISYDTEGYLLYRQHGDNASGKITSLSQKIKAIKKILFKWKGARLDSANKLLLSYDQYLSKDNRSLLCEASQYKESIKKKRAFVKNKRMKSNYFIVDFLFRIAVLFNLF